jgi:hypothetical protein
MSGVISVPYVPAACFFLPLNLGVRLEKAEVAGRWLWAISASGKRDFWNFSLPLDDETSELFVHFFWLIYTDDLSTAKNLLASSRQNWGLESCLYEFTVSKRLESGDNPMFSPTGVPNWVPYPSGVSTNSVLQVDGGQGMTIDLSVSKAKSSNTFKSVVRKRSILGTFSVTRRPKAVQLSFKKKRRLSGKSRLAVRRTKSAFDHDERVRANKSEWKTCEETLLSFMVIPPF